MALLEDGISVSIPTVLVGVGVALAAPILLPVTAGGLRPLAKTLVKGYLAVMDSAKEVMAEAGERFSDIVAEAEAERKHATNGARSGAEEAKSGSKHQRHGEHA